MISRPWLVSAPVPAFGGTPKASSLEVDPDKVAQYRQFYVKQLRTLSPEGQHALRDLNLMARNHGGRVMQHAFAAQILTGRYPEIKKFVISEQASLLFVMRADDKAATTAYNKRMGFQQALAEVMAGPLPPAPDYVPIWDMPKEEFERYRKAYEEAFTPQFTKILEQFPEVLRNFWGRLLPEQK